MAQQVQAIELAPLSCVRSSARSRVVSGDYVRDERLRDATNSLAQAQAQGTEIDTCLLMCCCPLMLRRSLVCLCVVHSQIDRLGWLASGVAMATLGCVLLRAFAQYYTCTSGRRSRLSWRRRRRLGGGGAGVPKPADCGLLSFPSTQRSPFAVRAGVARHALPRERANVGRHMRRRTSNVAASLILVRACLLLRAQTPLLCAQCKTVHSTAQRSAESHCRPAGGGRANSVLRCTVFGVRMRTGAAHRHAQTDGRTHAHSCLQCKRASESHGKTISLSCARALVGAHALAGALPRARGGRTRACAASRPPESVCACAWRRRRRRSASPQQSRRHNEQTKERRRRRRRLR